MLEWLVAGFIVGLTHAMPPGPITVEVLRRGVAEGLVSALKVDAGAVVADGIFFALIVIGLMQVINSQYGRLFLWICGCTLLLLLGIRGMYKAMVKKEGMAAGKSRMRRGLSPFVTGLLIGITSPFAIVWWTSVFAGSLAIIGTERGAMMMMFIGIALACLTWYALVGISGSLGRKWLTVNRMKALSLACSAMMLAFSAILFYRGYLALL